jgi:hypothetical protein
MSKVKTKVKKLIILFIVLLFTATSYSQIEVSPENWSSATDTSAFDGISRVALIVGTSDDNETGSPILSVNKTDDEDIKVILSYWPASMCEVSMLYVKFDNEPIIHIMKASYSIPAKRYIVRFNPNTDMNIKVFIEKLKTCKMLHMRLSNACGIIINADYTLIGAPEALEILQ